MGFVPLKYVDDAPTPAGIYSSLILLDALYHQSEEAIAIYAQATNTELVDYDDNPTSETPQFAVLIGQGEALVVLDGTTNLLQWLGHLGAFVVPGVDTMVPLVSFPFGVAVSHAYWQNQIALIRNRIWNHFRAIPFLRLNIIGHSYGAAAAHILGRQIANAPDAPAEINILTFGEPRSYDGRAAKKEPTWHARIITTGLPGNADDRSFVDPVTLIPPGFFSLNRLGFLGKVGKAIFSLSWSHFGDPWVISTIGIEQGLSVIPYLDLLPGNEYYRLVGSIGTSPLHQVDSAYLIFARLLLQRSGGFVVPTETQTVQKSKSAVGSVDLSIFDSYYYQWTGQPYLPRSFIGPRMTPAAINQGYGLTGPEVVNNDNYYDWTGISADASLVGEQSAQVIQLGGGPANIVAYTGGTGGQRTWWLFRGEDRELVITAAVLLRSMLQRDEKRRPEDPAMLPEGEPNFYEFATTLIDQFEFILGISQKRL